MNVKDLGYVTGKLLVMGGVYSNSHALDAFFLKLNDLDIPESNVICTGDIVAYCGDPARCVDLLKNSDIHILAGNCEQQIAIGSDECGCGFTDAPTCSLLSRGWYSHALSQTPKEMRNWMGELPDWITFIHNGLRYVALHGGASDISKFIWPCCSDDTIQAEIALIQDQIGSVDCVLASHTGIVMDRLIDGVRWYNSGALGMPAHNGNRNTTYGIIDTDIITKELTYNVQGAHDAMLKAGLTQGYHDSLMSGYWPSEETLPIELRRR